MQIPLPFRCVGLLVAFFLAVPSVLFAAAPSNEELMKKINALEVEVSTLKQQIAAQPAPTTEMGAEMAAEAEKAAEAPGPFSKAKEFFSKAEIHGFASAAYVFNFETPDTSNDINPIRVFDFDHNNFNLDVVELVFKKDVSGPGDIGFRTDLISGTTVPEVIHFTDVANGFDLPQNFDMQQAYVTYDVPIGNGLVVDAGKFITHMGYEVIEGYDGFNDNYSRSILFGFAIPFTHTGVRATYNINEHLYVMGAVSNGWDLIHDNNTGKTAGAQVAFDLNEQTRVYLNYIVGPEQEDDSDDIRQVGDICVTFKPNDQWTFGINGDLGHEQDVDIFETSDAIVATTVGGVTALDAEEVDILVDEDDATWGGVAGYVRYQFNDWLAFITRSEFFIDDDGARTGVDQDLWEITATVEAKVGDNFVVRPEYRYDHSNEDFFNGDNHQNTAALNGIYYF